MMAEFYNWQRRWILPGTREVQASNLSSLTQFWFPATDQANTNSRLLDELAGTQVVILLGEPGIGKSHEIRAYAERVQQSGGQQISVVLDPYPKEIGRLFEGNALEAWSKHQSSLMLLIDAFDETDQPPAQLGRELVKAIASASGPRERLFLRIACRTADWSEQITKDLQDLFGHDNIAIVELDVLGQAEVEAAATAEGIDASQFLQLIEQNALQALTLKPITLLDLLEEYKRRNGVLPGSRNTLYQNMCTRLCEEHNPLHDDKHRRVSFTAVKLLTEAARLAAVMIFTRRLTVWWPDSTRGMPESCIPVRELHHGTSDEEALTRATLQTGLFSSRGQGQLGWAHLSYAEYLAASYIHDHLSLQQMKSLLLHPSGNKIVPQLREVAAWLAMLDQDILAFVTEIDPEALFQSDLILEDTDTREKLVAILLDLYHREILTDIPFNPYPRYRRFCHPRLSDQLTDFVHDRSRNEMSRYVAMSMIRACDLSEAADALIDLAMDPHTEYQLRSHAAHVIAACGSDAAKLALKPLVSGSAQDINDELKGASLIALWPDHLTATELFEALKPEKNQNLIGTYRMFLQPELIDEIRNDDLPIALWWATAFIEQYSDTHNQLDLAFESLIDAIVCRSWFSFETAGVREALAQLVLTKASRFQELFGKSYRQDLIERCQQVKEDLLQNESKRRQLLLATVELVSPSQSDFSFLTYRIPLLLDSDLVWLIGLLTEGRSSVNKDTLLNLIKTVFRAWNPDHLDIMAQAIEREASLVEPFNTSLFVLLDSDYANQSWQDYRRHQEFEAKSREIEEQHLQHVIDPSPLERLEKVLEQCERGQIEEWWRTNVWLDTNEYGATNDLCEDVRQMRNWDQLDQVIKERVISLGVDYVFAATPEPEKWFGLHTVYRPAVAAYRMLFLLFDSSDQVPVELLAKWMPIIVTWPPYSPGLDHEKHNQFLKMAYLNDKKGFIAWLQEYMKYWHMPDRVVGSVAQYLTRFNVFFDEDLAQILMAYLDSHDITEDHYDAVLDFLLEKQISQAFNRALCGFEDLSRDLERARQAYQTQHHGTEAADSPELLRLREKAVRLATKLLRSPRGGDWWHSLWTVIQTDEDFGRSLIETVADESFGRRTARIGSYISEKEVADLYLWITERYPHREDPDLYGGSTMQAVTPRHDLVMWRDSLLAQLAERGTSEALSEIDRIGEVYPELHQLKRLRERLKDHLFKNTWHPPKVQEVLSLIWSSEARYIETEAQLLDLVIESLGRLQKRLQGETPSAVDLWNVVLNEGICRPKEENAISNYVKRHLEQDLVERGIVVNREVEIRQKVGGEGAAPGQIPDLYVSAISRKDDENVSRQLTLLIEVKGNWNVEVMDAAETQLVDRYLDKNDKTTCGLFLVGWFNCGQWDRSDSRRGPAMRTDYAALSQALKGQTAFLSRNGRDVRSHVLDISLLDTTSA